MHSTGQRLVALGIVLWEYNLILDIIFALVSSVAIDQWKKHQKHLCAFWASASCALICIVLIVFSAVCDRIWCIVPNLYSQSYSDAIESLYDSGLKGTELLPVSNQFNEKSNVVWQSNEKDSVSRKGKTVFFILDDNTKYEKSSASKSLGSIDSRRWTWEKHGNHGNIIKLMLPKTYTNMRTDKPNTVTFDVYAQCLGETLEEIVMDYCNSNTQSLQINSQKLEDYFLIGRLCANDKSDAKMQYIQTTSVRGTILLPVIMKDDGYGFYFSFYDQDGNHYDHAVLIELISEYE